MKQLALASLLLTLVVFCGAQTTNPESRILSYKDYARIKHDVPYVLEFDLGKGALLMYGGRHVFDPADPQIDDIQREWERFKPDVAYNEGGNPSTDMALKSAVERSGEAGLVRHLAARDAVPVATFEPREVDEVRFLLDHYSAEQVKVFIVLRSYLTFRKSKQDETADQYIKRVLRGPTWEESGIANTVRDLVEFQAACNRLFPGLDDWRKISDDWFDPAADGQFTNDAQNLSGGFRDHHIFQVLTSRARRGDRVFAVIGASHVPVQEPALVEMLGPPARKRNGQSTTSSR
jgi:hypothetical protein